MKRIVSGITSLGLLASCITGINGQSDTLSKVQSYWLNKQVISSIDEIFTVEALGLDVEDSKNNFELSYDFTAPVDSYGQSVEYETMDSGYLAKSIIALAAIKNDPTNLTVNNSKIDLVAILKARINEDGNMDYGTGSLEPTLAYTMFALKIVEPNYDLSKLGQALANAQLTEGSWGYNGSWPGVDITGWAIGALSLCNDTYQSNIDKAVEYLSSKQLDNGGYDNWGVNSNSQASVLWGLLEYDVNGLKEGNYNKNDNNPYDLLLQFMLSDGSFKYQLTDNQNNLYASVQSGLAIGVYENGSFIANIAKQYADYKNPVKEEKPVENTNQSTNVITSVKTGDDTIISITLGLLIVSGGLYLAIKKS